MADPASPLYPDPGASSMKDGNQSLTDDQKAELTKIKSDPRFADMKKLIRICIEDMESEENNPKPPKNDDDNIFDRIGNFMSGKK